MPTYAYRCADCDHSYDIYQQFSDATLTECPECGGRLRKVFGSLGVTFKGSGFYRTDSRAASSGSSSNTGSSGNSASSTAASGSSGGGASSGSSSSGGASSGSSSKGSSSSGSATSSSS